MKTFKPSAGFCCFCSRVLIFTFFSDFRLKCEKNSGFFSSGEKKHISLLFQPGFVSGHVESLLTAVVCQDMLVFWCHLCEYLCLELVWCVGSSSLHVSSFSDSFLTLTLNPLLAASQSIYFTWWNLPVTSPSLIFTHYLCNWCVTCVCNCYMCILHTVFSCWSELFHSDLSKMLLLSLQNREQRVSFSFWAVDLQYYFLLHVVTWPYRICCNAGCAICVYNHIEKSNDKLGAENIQYFCLARILYHCECLDM